MKSGIVEVNYNPRLLGFLYIKTAGRNRAFLAAFL
jgi:hypothetical protein